MKKMNNKGYMIVEIIVASVLAMTIAYFLFDLVIKLKEKYDYVQTDTVLTADKTVITNEILGDLYNKKIKEACVDSGAMKYIIEESIGEIPLKLSYDSVNKIIKYEDVTDPNNPKVIYQKKLNNKLQLPDKATISCDNNIASFIVKAETLTSKKNYNINIIIPVPSCTCS